MATIEQLPGDADITVVQGDSLSLQFTVATNYSGYTFVATVHELHGTESTASTVLTASASSSTVQVDFASAMTGLLAVTTNEGAHNWKLVQTNLSGNTRTWIKGAFTVVTKI